MTFARGRRSGARRRAGWLTLVAGIAALPTLAADPPRQAAKPGSDGHGASDAGDQERKSQLLVSDRWRRAMFEFNAWLDAQPVYSPTQVAAIRRELTGRVATMSSFELEYLLETISAKLKVLETPAARDARGWLGRYLAVMSDAKRAEVLRGVPNVLDMSAADLEAAVERIETKQAEVARRHDETLAARREFASFQQRVGREDAEARAGLAAGRDTPPAFSPYRGPAARSAPFAGAYESPTVVGASPWGSFLAVPSAAF